MCNKQRLGRLISSAVAGAVVAHCSALEGPAVVRVSNRS
jgi:hypothetical protein